MEILILTLPSVKKKYTALNKKASVKFVILLTSLKSAPDASETLVMISLTKYCRVFSGQIQNVLKYFEYRTKN